MSCRILHVVNPLAPTVGARGFETDEEISVLEALDRAGWRLPAQTLLVRDGKPVKRRDWGAMPLMDGEQAVLITLPIYGNKGGNGSQIFAMIAQIALMVLAPEIGGFINSALGLGLGRLGLAILDLAIVVAGKLLISALTPKPKQITSQAPQTYSLTAQNNAARLGGAIKECFGTIEDTPDFASQPWSEFSEEQQYLNELFCLGMGEYDIVSVAFGNNYIWKDGDYTGSFPEITLEFIPPGNQVTLFRDNVSTSNDVNSITMLGTTEAGYAMLGPFVVCKPGQTALGVQIDIECPEGLIDGTDHATVKFLFQAQEIDNAGNAIGSWFDIENVTLSLCMRRAVRRTYEFTFAKSGRYQVQGQRTNAKATDGSVSDILVWSALKGILPTKGLYPNCTMMALRAFSDGNLNSSNADQIKVVKTRKIRTWDSGTGTWTGNVATRSPAWAALYIATASNGGALADSRVDTAALIALDALWTSRSDWFDGIYDTQESLLDALQAAVAVGRTRMIMSGSTMTFVRDQQRSLYRTAFGPRSMLPNTLKVTYQMFDVNAVQSLAISYIDSRIWQLHTVLCKFDDSDDTIETATPMQFFGITDYAHAWREGIFLVAANRYRRRVAEFQTEFEGRVCQFGDLVSLGHYVASWGASADANALTRHSDGDVLTLSEPYAPPAGQETAQLYASILTPDGQVYGPITVSLLTSADPRHAQIKFTGTATVTVGNYAGMQPRDWPVWSGDGLQLERPRVMLGQGTVTPHDAIVTKMTPDDTQHATVTAILDDPQVYAADTGTPPDDPWDPSAAPELDLAITSIAATEGAVSGGNCAVSVVVSGAPDATGYYACWRTLYDGSFSTPVYFPGGPSGGSATLAWSLPVGALELLVQAAAGIGIGKGLLYRLTVDGTTDTAPPNVGTITTTDHWSKFTNGAWNWSTVARATSYLVQVQYQNNSSDDWHVARTVEVDGPPYTYYFTNSTTDGGPFTYALRVGFKGKNGAGVSPAFSFSSADGA